MSLRLVSELPREDTQGLSVWARPLLPSHFQEGGRGTRRNLTDLQVGANKIPGWRVVVGVFTGHLLCAGPCARPWDTRKRRKREVGGIHLLEFGVRRVGVRATGAHASPPAPALSPSYEVQLRDSVVSFGGCSQECWKDMVQKACCPGYWGSQCYGTEEEKAAGSAPTPMRPSPSSPV